MKTIIFFDEASELDACALTHLRASNDGMVICGTQTVRECSHITLEDMQRADTQIEELKALVTARMEELVTLLDMDKKDDKPFSRFVPRPIGRKRRR